MPLCLNKKKKLSINVNHDPSLVGPNGQLLLYGTPETPAVISGQIIFENSHEAKGGDMEITYSVLLGVEFTDKAENCVKGFAHKTPYETKKTVVALKHTESGKIKQGRHSADINFRIDPSFPSSMYLHNGSVVYKIRVCIPRTAPSADIIEELFFWVLNSNLSSGTRRGEKLLPQQVPECLGRTKDGDAAATMGVSYSCEVPATSLIAGETVAIALESVPQLESDLDDALVPLHGDQKGLPSSLPNRDSKKESETSKMPSIYVRLKQTITYWNRESSVSQHEHREFACSFQFDKDSTSRVNNSEGWRAVLTVALPPLGAKRADPKKQGVQDELEGLKASFNHPSVLRVDHYLQVDLRYDPNVLASKICKFLIPINIVPPAGPGPAPFRFEAVPWSSDTMDSSSSYICDEPGKMDMRTYNTKLAKAQSSATILHTVR